MAHGICPCGKPAKSRNLCSTCYWRGRQNGTLQLLDRPTAGERFWLKVNKTETCWLWTGAVLQDSKYGVIRWDSKIQPAHRVSWFIAGNDIPSGYELDHTCHVRLCVNPEHLRIVTRKQNSENHRGPQRNSSSGFRGVYRTNNRWRAEVWHNGTKHHLGYFDTAEDADAAARAKRVELFTHNDWDRHIERSTGSRPL